MGIGEFARSLVASLSCPHRAVSMAMYVLAEQSNCQKFHQKILLDAEHGFVIAR